MAGEETRCAIFAQPEWLRAVPTDRRLPEGRVLHTGCGTSFHAAQTGGRAEQALELVLRPRRADVLVAISHEGATALTMEWVTFTNSTLNGPISMVCFGLTLMRRGSSSEYSSSRRSTSASVKAVP